MHAKFENVSTIMRGRGLVAAILTGFVLSGCGGGGGSTEKTYPVKGKITLDGKPFGPANIVFSPIAKGARDCVGQVDAEGNVTVTTYQAGDGAPAGEFRVYVPPAASATPIPAVYQSATESPLRVKVSESGGEFSLAMDSSAGPPAMIGSQQTIPPGMDPSKAAMPKN